MLGPVTNSVCIVLGSVAGSVAAASITPRFRSKLMHVFSCITLGIGVAMTAKVHALPPVILSVLIGTLCGELCHVEGGVMAGAFKVAGLFPQRKGEAGLPEKAFRDQFAVATVLFCVSGLGILGAMHEGMTGDPSLLFIKALLDLLTALLFASSIGAVVGVLAVPQFLVQAGILLAAVAITPLTTPSMLADFSACGGIIMLGAGLRQSSLLDVPILSMLPGMLLVMPVSALWTRFMG